jgi:site-specific recombinase XerD
MGVTNMTTLRVAFDESRTLGFGPLQGSGMLAEYHRWLLAAGRSVGTGRIYVSHLEHLQADYPLRTVTTEQIESFLAARRHLAADTRKSYRSAFRSFFAWAHKKGHRPDDPAYELEPITVIIKPVKVASDAAVQFGLITADEWVTAMILLGRYGCLRLTELTTLHPRQREGDLLRITGKGEKQRMVPANDDLLAALLTLERIQGRDCHYFPGRFQPHLHPQSVNKIITRHLGINPHALRHAGATAAFEATHDLEAVRQMLGHASIATTQRYLHIGIDSIRAAAAGTTMRPPLTAFPTTTLPFPTAGGSTRIAA